MNTPGLFLAGFGVTLILGVALALLIYAAVLDGRDGAGRTRGGQPTPQSDSEPQLMRQDETVPVLAR